MLPYLCGAGGGTRTHTLSLATDFESASSTDSNTPANLFSQNALAEVRGHNTRTFEESKNLHAEATATSENFESGTSASSATQAKPLNPKGYAAIITASTQKCKQNFSFGEKTWTVTHNRPVRDGKPLVCKLVP